MPNTETISFNLRLKKDGGSILVAMVWNVARNAAASGVTLHSSKNKPNAPQAALVCEALCTSNIIVLLKSGTKLPVKIANFTIA